VSWRLGQQILALACDDGDTLITTRLAVPLLRKRLGAAAAAKQAEAAQRAYDVLLAEEAAAEAAAREKSAQEAARRAAKKSVKKASAASSGNGNDAGGADANGDGHDDTVATGQSTPAGHSGGAAAQPPTQSGADELRASREAALAAKRAKEEEEREAALEERRRQLLASDDAFWRAREEADTAAAIAASSAEVAVPRSQGAEPRGGKSVSNGHAPHAATAPGKASRGVRGGEAERSAAGDAAVHGGSKAAPHPATAVATQPQGATGKGGPPAKPAARDRGAASHVPAVEPPHGGAAHDGEARAPPKGQAPAAAATASTGAPAAQHLTHQNAIAAAAAACAAAVAGFKARPLPMPRPLQQQQGGDKTGAVPPPVEVALPAKESPSLEAVVQRALAAKEHKPGSPGAEAAATPAPPQAQAGAPKAPAAAAAPPPPTPPPAGAPPSSAASNSSALRVNAAEFVPSSGMSATPPLPLGTPPMGAMPPQMMGPPPPQGGQQPPLFFGMAAPLAPPPPGILPIGASFPIPGAPGYSWLVAPHGYVAIGPTGVPLVPQMVPQPGGPPQAQQQGVGGSAQGGPPMLWPPGPVPPPAGTVPWVPQFGAMPPVPLDAPGNMVMMPSVTPPLPLGPPAAPVVPVEPPGQPPQQGENSAGNVNASRALMQLLMSGTTATSLPPPPPTQATPPAQAPTSAKPQVPTPEARAPPADADARAPPPAPGAASSNYTSAVSGGGGRPQAVTRPTPRRPTAPAPGPPPPVPRLASPTPLPATAPAVQPAAPLSGGQQPGGRGDALGAALVALHASAAVRAATLALPPPPHNATSQPCPVRAVRTLFASAETRGFHGNHLANLLASASSALAAAQPPAAASQPVSAAAAVQAVVQALTQAASAASATGALALCDALCPDVASATSCGTCGAVTPVPAPTAGSAHPGACVRHVSAGGLSMVRALLGPHAPIASLLRELGAQEPAPCGAPGCGAAACAVRRSVRVVPPAVCLGIEWADLQAGAGPQGVAPSDMTAVLDALVSPLDVPASYSDAGTPSGGSAGAGGASSTDRTAVHSLRALILAPPPGSSRHHVVYTLPAEATSGWAMQYPPATGDRSGDGHGHGPTSGAPRDVKLSWAALKAKCVKDGVTPVVALFTRDA
jgi:hypothetical protein